MDWIAQPLIQWFQDSPFSTATWIDWIDIALLSYLTYRVLLLIRGTRALQSLVGLGILAVVYLISDRVGLQSIHWLLDRLFVYVVIALLILFQEDIRRVLARAGSPIMLRSSGSPADANLREEVIQAVFDMAHRKIGALLVLRRTATLEPLVEGAHILDAEVSTELLKAVFHPTSPIHDGAVIIAHGRVVAAGVFLPIATSKTIMKAYGTRHRAAIGLTESIDAVCIVVSEERGTVSLVNDGKVIPVADPDDLRERLQEALLTGKDPAAKNVRHA